MTDAPFDPSKHLTKLRGGAEYLPIAARLEWFRSEYPDGRIETTHITLSDQIAVFRADVTAYKNGEIKGRATGHGSETPRDFADFIEKAETKAIGRALAALGFGTQFVGDEGDRIADAPLASRLRRTDGNAKDAPQPRQEPRGASEPMDLGDEIIAEFYSAIEHAQTVGVLEQVGKQLRSSGVSDDGLRAAYKVKLMAFQSTA